MAETLIPVDPFNLTDDFKNSVSFAEEAAEINCAFIKTGRFVTVVYMGESKAHGAGANLFTLPEGYRPAVAQRIPFVANAAAYGVVTIGQNGVAQVGQISSTTVNARINFSATFPV